jgi:hypothetical protein
MITRRSLLGGAAAAATVPLWTSMTSLSAAAGRLPLDLVNRRIGHRAYAVVSGRDPVSGRWFFLAADGKTKTYPRAGRTSRTPLNVDTAIPLSASGATRRLVLPPMESGRVYLSLDRKLRFFVNPDGGIATPSVTDPHDPNAATEWTFFELTHDGNGVYANISFVDFVGVPLSLRLKTASGTQRVGGLERTGLSRIAAGLRTQSSRDGSGWRKLIVSQGGRDLRILSPNLAAHAAGRNPVSGYLDPYIRQVWQKYRSVDLTIDTQSRWGTVVGRVRPNDRLTFPRIGSFAQPSTYAVFNCSVAPFVTANNVMGNLSARLAAALNRTTLLTNSHQPDATQGSFYRAAHTNHYARLIHAHTAGGAGYAFPYDDVHTARYNTEGRVVHPRPQLLSVEVG